MPKIPIYKNRQLGGGEDKVRLPRQISATGAITMPSSPDSPAQAHFGIGVAALHSPHYLRDFGLSAHPRILGYLMSTANLLS